MAGPGWSVMNVDCAAADLSGLNRHTANPARPPRAGDQDTGVHPSPSAAAAAASYGMLRSIEGTQLYRLRRACELEFAPFATYKGEKGMSVMTPRTQSTVTTV